MDSPESRTEKLVDQIEHAFRQVERPQITLRVARAVDDHRFDQLDQMRKLDDHYGVWTSIPRQDIEEFADVFPWLCPIGFRFYLPAFMVHSLRSSRCLADEIWPEYAFGNTFFQESHIEILDQPQKQAVRDFLIVILKSVKDDYNEDWWNHPWDPEWEEDSEKERIWKKFGKAFAFINKYAADAC